MPKPLLVRSPKARNKATALACESSLLENRAALPGNDQTQTIDGLHVFALPAALGYPWTVIPVEHRNEYMDALEAASTASNIRPLADFLSDRVNAQRA